MSNVTSFITDIRKISSIENTANLAAPKDSPTFTGTVSGITSNMVGAEGNTGLNGYMDTYEMYNRALTQQEIVGLSSQHG